MNMNIRYLSWDEIETAAYNVASRIISSGFRPEIVVAIARGGLIPARLLSDYLGIPEIGFIEIKFYTEPGKRKEKPVIKNNCMYNVENKRILIVDDVADTGKSISVASSMIDLYGPSHVKTATLYLKPWSIIVPDYYYKVVDEWIIFPWEKVEFAKEYSLNELLKAVKKNIRNNEAFINSFTQRIDEILKLLPRE